MSRVEENKELIDVLGKLASMLGDLGGEPTDSYTISNIFVVLADISKSLAVIADKVSEENNES